MTALPDTGTVVPLRPVTPMDILAARLAELARSIADSDLLVDPKVMAEVRELNALAAGLQPYLERCSTPASPTLRGLADRTRTHDWSVHPDDSTAASGLEPEMLSGHVEGKFLQMLVHATQAQRVLEIGMFTGYAALAMAEALPAGGTVHERSRRKERKCIS